MSDPDFKYTVPVTIEGEVKQIPVSCFVVRGKNPDPMFRVDGYRLEFDLPPGYRLSHGSEGLIASKDLVWPEPGSYEYEDWKRGDRSIEDFRREYEQNWPSGTSLTSPEQPERDFHQEIASRSSGGNTRERRKEISRSHERSYIAQTCIVCGRLNRSFCVRSECPPTLHGQELR